MMESETSANEVQDKATRDLNLQLSRSGVFLEKSQELDKSADNTQSDHPQNIEPIIVAKTEGQENCDIEIEDFEWLEKPELDEILLWREEFLNQKEARPGVLDASNEVPCRKVALELLESFRRMTPNVQAMVLVGMSFSVLFIGYDAWPFFAWAWPRLIGFATRFKVAAGAAWIQTMVKSKAYRKLLIAWETGQPITPALIRSLGPDFGRVVKSQGASLLQMK